MRNLKRALSLALAAIMVMGLMVVGASAASTYDNFTDKDEIVNTEAVNTMVSLGVFEGKDDGSYFDPNGIVTRGEMAKIIAVCLNGGKDPVLGDSTNIPKFSDVPASHWAYNYIAYCVQQGIIAGRGDGTFDPGAAVTGSEAAKMFLCALGYRADLEGLLGNEWELNTNVLANQDAKLYAGLTGINPSQGLSRDNTAQMAYNAVQAQEVYYDNLQGDYTGVLQTFNKGTMLTNRFKVVKVEGVVVANEVYGINGNGKTVAGKTRLADTNTYTDSNGNTQNYNGTYNISMGNDLMGRRVVIYVQFQNALAPNAESATVLGEPILSNKNTVASTSDRLKDTDAVEDFLNDNGLNIGTADALHGVYAATKDGVSGKLTSGTTTYAAPTLADGLNGDNLAQGAAGRLMTFIDHNGDGTVDFIFSELKQLGRVSAYNEDKSEITLSYVGTQKFADVVGVENVAKGDIVLYVKYGNTYYVELAETVEGTVSSYAAGTVTSVDIDGTSYKASQVDFDSSTGLTDFSNGSGMSSMVGNSYTMYLDNYGNGIAWKETELSDSNLALIMGSGISIDALGNPKGEVKLMLSDGTTGTYTVNLLGSANRYNINNANVNDNTSKERWMAWALEKGVADANTNFDGTVVADTFAGMTGVLVAVSIDGTTVTLGDPVKVNSNYELANGTVTGLKAGNVLDRTISKYSFANGGDVVVNDSTIFFFDSTVAGEAEGVALGLSKLPTNGTTVNNTTTMQAIYTTQANGTKVAKAVFVNAEYKSSYNYAYVTGGYTEKKLDNGERVYSYPVVLETGEVSTLTTKLGGTYTDTVVRYEPDTTAGYYVFTTAGVAGDANIYNGLVVTATDGLSISTVRGMSGVSVAFTAVKDLQVWNVEDVTGKTAANEDTLGIGSSICLVLDNEGYVKTAFVNDTDLEISTVTNSTGSTLSYRNNPDNLTSEATVNDTRSFQAAGTYSIQIVKADGAALTAGQYVNYTVQPKDGGTVKTYSAKITTVNGTPVASITMPDVESIVTLTGISATPAGDSSTGGGTTAGNTINPAASDVEDIVNALKDSSNTTVTVTGSLDPASYLDTTVLEIPAGKTLVVEGDFTANANVINRGTLEVKGTFTSKQDTLMGNITAEALDFDASVTTPIKVTGNVTLTNASKNASLTETGLDLNVASGASLTVDAGVSVKTFTSKGNVTMGGTLTTGGTGAVNVTGGQTQVADISDNGAITVDGGTLKVTKSTGAMTNAKAITVTGNGTMTVAHSLGNNAITLGETGVATSKGTLTVGATDAPGAIGSGAVTLHGTSSLTAGTLGGTLALNNTASATVASVASTVTDAAASATSRTSLTVTGSTIPAFGSATINGKVTFSNTGTLTWVENITVGANAEVSVAGALNTSNKTTALNGKLTVNDLTITSSSTNGLITIGATGVLTVNGTLTGADDTTDDIKGSANNATVVFGAEATLPSETTSSVFKDEGGAALEANEYKGGTFVWDTDAFKLNVTP